MNQKIVNILLSILAAIVLLPIYIFLHEGGHALVSILCGAKITSFSIIGAYMSSEGGNFNRVTSSMLHAAGALVPLLVSAWLLLFYKKGSSNHFYHIAMYMIGIMSIGNSLAWVFVPLLYMMGNAPENDDITKFLEVSKIHPVIVCLCALIVVILYIILMWKKQLIQRWWRIIQKK